MQVDFRKFNNQIHFKNSNPKRAKKCTRWRTVFAYTSVARCKKVLLTMESATIPCNLLSFRYYFIRANLQARNPSNSIFVHLRELSFVYFKRLQRSCLCSFQLWFKKYVTLHFRMRLNCSIVMLITIIIHQSIKNQQVRYNKSIQKRNLN